MLDIIVIGVTVSERCLDCNESQCSIIIGCLAMQKQKRAA